MTRRCLHGLASLLRAYAPRRERERERERRLCYADIFYRSCNTAKYGEHIFGFPTRHGWCKGLKDTSPSGRFDFKADLRKAVLPCSIEGERQRANNGISICGCPGVQRCTKARCIEAIFSRKPANDGQKINIIHYLGIAADEPLRIAKHLPKADKVLPLVQIGWDEALCGLEAQYMDMLSPTYSDGNLRDGCWFCHNQGVAQLRRLRKLYPDLWALLMKWDADSPVAFRADGRTVHDFDRRFQMEDDGLIDSKAPFRWAMLDDDLNYNLFAEMD